MHRRAKPNPRFADSVFINCPIDLDYWPIFEAIVFCVIDCGFVPRSALEEVDSGQVRLLKIQRLIRSSRYAVHDLSRIEVTASNPLPRFNMPFEFGLDLGCRLYGTRKMRKKKCLVLEAQRYRYQAVLSDISGQDIRCHNNSPSDAIAVVRDWLRTASGRKTIPGAAHIQGRFASFTSALPSLADRTGSNRRDIQFVEYVTLAEEWLRTPVPA